MVVLRVLAVILALATPCAAQSTAFDRLFPGPGLPTQGERNVADALSYVPVAVSLGLDFKDSCWQSANRRRGCALFGMRVGAVELSTFVLKTIANRQRPCAPSHTCGIDSANSSFPSAHAAFTWSALGGPGFAVTIPMGVAVDVGRDLANKHWPTDVLAGSAIGALFSRIR